MTEYATTPSAIEEWKNQRSRTADWVHSSIPGLPPSPDEDSDSEKRSLWDGAGWEAPSECESATSVPPTMMLQYPDARQVLVTPTTSESNTWSHNGSKNGTRRARAHTHLERRDEERTERARTPRSAEHVSAPARAPASVPKSVHDTGAVASQTSSMRLARAAAAPLPESRSSSSASGSGGAHSASKRSVHASAVASVPAPVVHSAHPHTPSHHSHVPSHQLSHVPSHHPSHVPSYHSQPQQPQHPPSAFSTHTVGAPLPPPPAGANGSPPSINSINSRSISLADSRSSGPPEPIVIHPPTASSHSTTGPGPSPTHVHAPGSGHGGVYPQMYLPSTSLTTQTVPPAAHVPLPPPSSASASLSYYSVPRQSRVYEQHHQQQQQQRQSVTPSHHTAQVAQNAQLPTPVSPTPHMQPIHTSMPMRATSSTSATGLDGGFVLVDAPSPGYEQELERELGEKKGSFGNKSTASQRRERGSLFNVFGGGKQGGHNRSRSLPVAGMEDIGTGAGEGQQAPGSPASHHTHRSHHSQQNPYLTPISPVSPVSPSDPARGPHPPSIVYAPARHHRATHYAPPRIMYMPASPHGQRHAPYDTHQLLHAQGYPQYGVLPSAGYVPAQVPGTGHAAEYGGGSVSAGSVRRAKTVEEGVRDSGWGEGKRDGSAVRLERGANAEDYLPHDFGYEHAHSPVSPRATAVHANADPVTTAVTPSASPAVITSDPARAASMQSDATSVQTNMAGVGTISARSRSRGRGRNEEHEGERSRSRARGMVYSSSAPQPQGSAPPHAAMMVPPSTGRDRGVRDTPYPTPPGSASEHHRHHQQQQQQQQHSLVSGVVANGHHQGSSHRPTYAPESPTAGEASSGPGGLISRFRDIYHPSHGAAADRDASSTSPSRGRARERRKKERQPKTLVANGHGHGRSRSVDSEVSQSSASTYYVIPTPGQKVRIIRTDGQTVTATTSVSRNPSGGGWLKKAAALRPRFMHRDTTNMHPAVSDPSAKHRGEPAPALASSRTPSGGSGTGSAKSTSKKGGRKLVRRNSTGSAALLSISRQASAGMGAARDVDVVVPGR